MLRQIMPDNPHIKLIANFLEIILSPYLRCVYTLDRWFKEENEQLLPLQLSERITMVSAGLLKITKVR